MKTKRKNIFKSLLALTLALIMVLGVAPLSEFAGVDWARLFAPKAEAAEKTYKVGDIVSFGSYPQSRVTDSATVSALDKISKNWVSYGYYSGNSGGNEGSMKPGDWMQYADISLGGTKYRAVRFTQYRPRFTTFPSSSDDSYQDDNGYTVNNVYYFKYEPLKWRVLDPKTGLVLSESIIDSQAYSNTIYQYVTDPYGDAPYWNDAEHTHYANDYATSSIRKWLNEDFYNTAFTSAQQANILTTELDNKAYSTYYSKFDSETTYDKVFLLSYSEAQNASYGFTSSASRKAKGTDYAKCQGLGVNSSNECSFWRLRSAGYYYDYDCHVNHDGVVDHHHVDDTNKGVRPALKISNLDSAISESGDFDPSGSAPFNQPTYIADIWSGNRKEKTPEHEQLSWYYNGYKPITRTIVEEMGDTAFKFWDGVKCVSNPANGAEIALKKEKQRELIIFDAIRDVLGSPEFSDIISTSAASDLVGWTKSLNSAAKKIYGAEGIKTFEDFYNKYGKDNSSGKKKTKALVEAAYADYRQDVGAVNCLSDLLTCVDSVLKIAKSSKEVINAFVNCMMVARMRESLKAVIDEMYAQSTDSDMRTALSNVKNYCVSEMDALAGTMVRSVAGIGVTVLKEFVGDFWDDLADMVPIAGPIIKGVKIGAAVGEGICNMLFSTGNTRDNYYLAKSTVEFVDIARKASLSLQKKYSANRTTEAANAYIDSVRLYISVLNLDAENGRKFCKTACNDGLINGVANWINGGNAKYDEIERCTNSIQKTNNDFVDLISISWIFADNYLKTDYPEMYDTLCQNILTSPKYASTITQVKIDLSGKATVYFDVPSYAAGFKPVSGVQVQYKKNNGSYSMLADLANPYAKSASHSITLSNSDTYTYRVRTYAKLTTGKIEYSDWSEEYTTLANPAETPEIYCKVGAIGVDVRVKNNYFLSTGFNESQSGVVTTVEIYRRRQGESGKKLIGTISDVDRVNLFTDKNPGTTKCYYSARTVVRYNGKTYYSKYSQEVCTIMSGNIPKDPRLDINIRANSSSPKTRAVTYADAANGFSIELAWDKIDGISTYEVYRKLDEAKLYVYIGKTDSGNTSFVDNTVSEAGRYDYIIKFYQDIGGEKVLCGESQSASVLVERVAQQTETVEIKKGKTATISINSGNLSDGSTVSWSTSSDCITLTPSEDGTSCEVKANSKGSATVTVTITHADGSTVSDTFEIEAKSKGIFATIFDIILAPFRAIINLFKKLFGK
mgnify:FL=1